MPVRIARVYDAPGADDGARVLVDRLWPRGLTKEAAALDEWLRDVAPSTELRKWYGHDPSLLDEFTARYRAELAEAPAADALGSLRELSERGPIVLLTASKTVDISHAAVLADLLS
jgi:uncharacterized protein YeaO (DUF488 family)